MSVLDSIRDAYTPMLPPNPDCQPETLRPLDDVRRHAAAWMLAAAPGVTVAGVASIDSLHPVVSLIVILSWIALLPAGFWASHYLDVRRLYSATDAYRDDSRRYRDE